MVKIQMFKERVSINKVDRQKVHKKNVFIPIIELRITAMNKLRIKDERVAFNNEEIKKIEDLLNSFRPQNYDHYIGVISQIQRDIAIGYKKFDALAMWLDSDNGLAKFEPALIRSIAIKCGL